MATELYLPPTFPYPIKVVALDVSARDSVQRGTRLLTYSFVHLPGPPATKPETRYGTWDSAVEGVVEAWKIKPGDVISEHRSRDRPVVLVTEPCKHGVQIGGLCGLCGKDMTGYDYTGFSDAARASIQMNHSAFGPTVSLEEARKIEKQTAERLLRSRKLSLIVDLDQTIVHATVDPTVGEWIAEGEAWEARHRRKPTDDSDDSDSSASESDESESEHECNPNWWALKDVKKFRLSPESFGQVPLRELQKGKGKGKLLENEGCMYYIKPRPGWKEFLRDTAEKYEMHVYTMGTRAYAEEVCSAIDPDNKIFGGRILSRDESGSLTQKSLQRLFPCDTSMVVIIDDRADVWEWSPNLIKVIPYDFFIGIGDINSTFLPRVDPLLIPSGPSKLTPSSPSSSSNLPPEAQPSLELQASSEGAEQAKMATDAMLTQNSLALEAQLEERPLAKKQEELQGTSEDKLDNQQQQSSEPPEPSNTSSQVAKPTNEGDRVSLKPDKVARKALLKNDDTELQRISKLLDEVHKRFFTAYDNRLIDKSKRRLSISRLPKVPYDITAIIPRMRGEALTGVHILFSSVIPLDTRPETTEIWRMAHMFGARCSTELTKEVTHVVAEKRGTIKVDAARKRGGIMIVRLAWLVDSISLWRRQDETSYLLDDPRVTTSGMNTEPNVIYVDAEPENEDWEMSRKDTGEGPSSFKLGEIDWNEINDEVDAAMNESDDEEDEEARSGNLSEDDWTDESNSIISSTNTTPRLGRKRIRSVTPSDGPVPVNGENKDDSLRSPLAKRKKLAAERTGLSRLKEAISAEDLKEAVQATSNNAEGESPSHGLSAVVEDDGDGDDEDASEEEDDEDDFLARELEEELG